MRLPKATLHSQPQIVTKQLQSLDCWLQIVSSWRKVLVSHTRLMTYDNNSDGSLQHQSTGLQEQDLWLLACWTWMKSP